MKKLLLFLLTPIVVCSSPYISYAHKFVAPKVILEIQPFMHELIDEFSLTAQAKLYGNGYTHSAKLEGWNVGEVTLREVDLLLRQGGNGLLLIGGHGSPTGATYFQSFDTEDEAIAKRAELIGDHTFAADELTAPDQPVGDDYWMLGLTKKYTDYEPAVCHVAFISTCHGDASGTFSAKCKVFAIGSTGPATSMTCFSCMIAKLWEPPFDGAPTYQTIGCCTTCKENS